MKIAMMLLTEGKRLLAPIDPDKMLCPYCASHLTMSEGELACRRWLKGGTCHVEAPLTSLSRD
jgi:hypothetical protein